MGAQKGLKKIAILLLAVTVLCAMVIPPQADLTFVSAVLAGADAIVFLALLAINFRSKHGKLGKLEILMSVALILLLGSGAVMGLMNNSESYKLSEGEQVVLSGIGVDQKEILVEDINGRPVERTKVDLALVLKNDIIVHHTLTQSEPIYFQGMQVNLIDTQGETVALQVKYNPVDKVLKIGGILLLVGLILTAVSAGRRKKGVASDV